MANQTQPCAHCGEQCCIEGCHKDLCCYNDCCGCCVTEICIEPNRTLPSGTILAMNDDTGRFDAYDPAGAKGLNYPRGILRYDVTTDEDGKIWDGSAGPHGLQCPKMTTCMYYCGTFENKYIPDMLPEAVAAGFAHLIDGRADGAGLFKIK